MKNIKLFICSLICMAAMTTASAQVKYFKTVDGKYVPAGQIDTSRTLDATPVIAANMTVANNTGGLVEVTVVGSASNGECVTGKLLYHYHKTAGTITVATADTVGTITADTGLSGATFAVAANASNNLKLTLTGKASKTILWKWEIKPYYHR